MRCQICDFDEHTVSVSNEHEGYPSGTKVSWVPLLKKFLCTHCVKFIRQNQRYYRKAWEKDGKTSKG